MLKDIDDFHKTPLGYGVFAGIELALAYAVGIRAIDTGNMWFYALAIVLVFGVIQNIFFLIKNHTELVHKSHAHHRKSRKKA